MLSFKKESLKKIDMNIFEIAHGEEYREQAEKLIMLHGVKEITTMGLITEIVDFRRFKKPRELMAYLGLIPGERSSGEEQRRCGITKTSNMRVRRLLIEAAWHYQHRPIIKERKTPELDEAWEIARKAQIRLHSKFWRLVCKGKLKTKAVTAVARELTGFIWAIMKTA